MDRNRLIELAPQYYEIAVCDFFYRLPHTTASRTTLSDINGMRHASLLDYVLRALVDKKMLVTVPDEFGPTLYVKTKDFDTQWGELQKIRGTPAFKWALDPYSSQWLEKALREVNRSCTEHNLSPKDFANPEPPR